MTIANPEQYEEIVNIIAEDEAARREGREPEVPLTPETRGALLAAVDAFDDTRAQEADGAPGLQPMPVNPPLAEGLPVSPEASAEPVETGEGQYTFTMPDGTVLEYDQERVYAQHKQHAIEAVQALAESLAPGFPIEADVLEGIAEEATASILRGGGNSQDVYKEAQRLATSLIGSGATAKAAGAAATPPAFSRLEGSSGRRAAKDWLKSTEYLNHQKNLRKLTVNVNALRRSLRGEEPLQSMEYVRIIYDVVKQNEGPGAKISTPDITFNTPWSTLPEEVERWVGSKGGYDMDFETFSNLMFSHSDKGALQKNAIVPQRTVEQLETFLRKKVTVVKSEKALAEKRLQKLYENELGSGQYGVAYAAGSMINAYAQKDLVKLQGPEVVAARNKAYAESQQEALRRQRSRPDIEVDPNVDPDMDAEDVASALSEFGVEAN
jgi:hypothetical protein